MQRSDPDQPQRGRRIVAVIAVLALLGLILAVLIASCSGGAEPAVETGATAETGVAAETLPAETGEEAAAEPAETEPAETEEQATEPAETETDEATTEPGETTTDEDARPDTVVDAAAEAGTFDTLSGLLAQSGLNATLAGDGPFTLFAPTDEAFDALPKELLAALEDEPEALEQLLSYHVVAERIAPDALVPGSLTTLEGAPLEIVERDEGRLDAGDAPILEPPVEAVNGWLYPIGYVLLPPDLDLTDLVGEEVAAEAYDRADVVVFFATGSAELDASAQQTIAEAAAQIEGLPEGSLVRLVGVADPTGAAAANLELSRQRARAVQAALQQAAPAADVRYVVRAIGEEEAPELANARRVDIVLVPGG